MALFGLGVLFAIPSCSLIALMQETSRSTPTTTTQIFPVLPGQTIPTTTVPPLPCRRGNVTQTIDFGSFPRSFPPSLCLYVGSVLTVYTGQGWSRSSSTNDDVLHELSSTGSPQGFVDTYKATAVGDATLQASWNPPVGSGVTSVQWNQAVTIQQ